MPEAKPYNIPKQLVWNAYQRVKANRGAAGVDGVSLTVFEKDLKGNLYKIWNRMSSGSYIPPPVRHVEIKKDGGGTRASRHRSCQVQVVVLDEDSPSGCQGLFHPDSHRPPQFSKTGVCRKIGNRFAAKCEVSAIGDGINLFVDPSRSTFCVKQRVAGGANGEAAAACHGSKCFGIHMTRCRNERTTKRKAGVRAIRGEPIRFRLDAQPPP